MWPFRRRQSASSGRSHQAAATRATRQVDWPALPPVQRVLTEPPVVVETASFEAELPTRRAPTFLAPLTHQVSLEAPAGTADLARPITVSRDSELALLSPPTGRPRSEFRPGASATVTPPRPTLLTAPQVARLSLDLPSVSRESSAEDTRAQVEAGPPAPAPPPTSPDTGASLRAAEMPTLGARPHDPAPRAEQAGSPPVAAATTRGWRPAPGGVGLPLREVPRIVQRSTTADSLSGAPIEAVEPAAGQASLGSRRPDGTDKPAEPAPADGDATDGSAPLVGDRPLPRQASQPPDPPVPVQLSRAAEQPEVGPPRQLPGRGASPFAPASTTGSRPLLGAVPLLVPGAHAATGPVPTTGASGPGPHGAAPSGPAAQRELAALVAKPIRAGADQPAVQLLSAASAGAHSLADAPASRTPAVHTSATHPPTSHAPASHATAGYPSGIYPPGRAARSAPLAPVQRSPALHAADPGAAAINAGVASRHSDGSVVFRSFLDDATSSVKDAASSAASSAISDARSTATDAASSTLSSASDAAHGAVSKAASTVASAAGLPSPGGGAATGDLDDLARKLYDRLRFRLTTELRLDRERSGWVTDLPR